VKEIRIPEAKKKLDEKKTPYSGDYFILNSHKKIESQQGKKVITKKKNFKKIKKIKKPSP
jgi:hypothetical protein